MASLRNHLPLKLFCSIFFAGLAIAASCAADEVTVENRVSYLGRPAVVMITSEYYGNLMNDDGESTVYLSSDDPEFELELDIPSSPQDPSGRGLW